MELPLPVLPETQKSTSRHKSPRGNLSPSYSTSKLNTSKGNALEFKQEPMQSGFTITGMQQATPDAQSEKRDETSPSNSPFGMIRAKLPKLYNNELYNVYSNKISEVKEKYLNIHQQLQNEEETAKEKPLRDLIKETEGIFSKSYSIKYFGINKDQIGIMSRRVPIKQVNRQPQLTININSPLAQLEYAKWQKYNAAQQIESTRSNPALQTKNAKVVLSSTRLRGAKTSMSSGSGGFNSTHEMLGRKIEGDSWQGERKEVSTAENQKDAAGTNPKENIEKAETLTNFNAQDPQEYLPQPDAYNVFVVNKYFIPKQLHAIKKKRKNSKSFEKVEQLIEFQLNAKLDRVPKNPKILTNYERLAKGLTKVKRSMLRAPMSRGKFGTDPTQAQIIEADKFKTEELKRLLAEKDNLSYAKLIGSLEKPNSSGKLLDGKALDLPNLPRKNQAVKEYKISPRTEFKPQSARENLTETAEENVTFRISQEHPLYHNYVKIAKKYNHEQNA